MLYHWFELNRALFHPARMAAKSGSLAFSHPMNPVSYTGMGRSVAAYCDIFERTTRQYGKPIFDIPKTTVDGEEVVVQEETVWRKPFCRLVHFKRDVPAKVSNKSPRVLLIAPMSGHYATLLRGTVKTFLPHAEVYITDWKDARMVPISAGRFDLNDYISYLIEIMELFEGDVHAVAVCQPSVPLIAGIAHLEAEKSPHVPNSFTVMGGPIDTRINPTSVNQMADARDIGWFQKNVLTMVPMTYPGAGRIVYPGFLQLSSFLSMNLDSHADSHRDYFNHLIEGDGESAKAHEDFYDEYMAVMDLTAEFFLDSVDKVFMRHQLPRGTFKYKKNLIDLKKITRVPLMTVEGERDDITGVGQCSAAYDLCSGLKPQMKRKLLQPGVGHYGVFNGSKFRNFIFPQLMDFIHTHENIKRRTKRLIGLSTV